MTSNLPEQTADRSDKKVIVRRRRRRLPWFFCVLLLLGGTGLWQGWAWWRWSIAPMSVMPERIQLQIPEGTSSQQIGADLRELGVIRSEVAWRFYGVWLKLSEKRGSFKAGTYQLDLSGGLPAIATTIWRGEVVRTSVTIPEGWSLKQMAEYFEKNGLFAAEEFLSAAQNVSRQEFPWLPPDIPHLEGFLYPDTYFLSSDSPQPEEVIKQMLERFAEVALPLYEQAKVPLNLSLNEWVTLSSIVEKEAVISEERRTIAGVFMNRLQRGMKLETDPTVEYALNIRQTKEQPLTFEQIKTDSPYNTYLYTGLPPTAIAAPGIASLQATLNPEKTDFLFFVAKYDGTHVFSKTLKEHETATKKIRAAVQ